MPKVEDDRQLRATILIRNVGYDDFDYSDESDEEGTPPDELDFYLKQLFQRRQEGFVGHLGIPHPTVGITVSCSNVPRSPKRGATKTSRAPHSIVSLLVPGPEGHRVHAETEPIHTNSNPNFLRPLVIENGTIQQLPDDQQIIFALHELVDQQEYKLIGKVILSLQQLVSAHGNFVSYNLTDTLDNPLISVNTGYNKPSERPRSWLEMFSCSVGGVKKVTKITLRCAAFAVLSVESYPLNTQK